MTLLDDLENLAGHLTPAELPHNENVQQTVGAIVKVLEHQGVTVAEDLLPAATVAGVAPEAEAVAAAAAVAPEAASALHDLLTRAETVLAELEGHKTSAPTEAPAAPADPAPGEPVQPPVEGAA